MDKVKITDSVRLRRGVEIQQLPLGPQDGFVLSRVDGSTRVKDIVAATGLSDTQVLDILQNLIALTVIHVDHNRDDEVDLEEPQGPPVTLTEPQKEEPVDLPPDTRLRILQVAWFARHGSHYEVLGLKRTASADEVKKTYYERSREFHPDSFFRKKLGSYKPLVEVIFKAVKKASDELSDPVRRGEYDKNLPKEVVVAPAPAPTPEWKLDPRRKAEAEARRLKTNPMVQRVERAQRHVARAKELVASKQWHLASNELILAAAQDPRDATVLELTAHVNAELRKEKFTRQLARLEALCTLSDPTEEEAGKALRELMDVADPTDLVSHLRMARTLMKANLKKLARLPADRAHKAAPDDQATLMIMVDLSEDAGLILQATRHLERLNTLAPTAERKARLEELRKRIKQAR